MQIFRVKWENIMTMMLLAATIYGWVVYFKYATEVKMLALATITTFALIMMLICYRSIREFRNEAMKLWK